MIKKKIQHGFKDYKYNLKTKLNQKERKISDFITKSHKS